MASITFVAFVAEKTRKRSLCGRENGFLTGGHSPAPSRQTANYERSGDGRFSLVFQWLANSQL
jgi:hypothetical protein